MLEERAQGEALWGTKAPVEPEWNLAREWMTRAEAPLRRVLPQKQKPAKAQELVAER